MRGGEVANGRFDVPGHALGVTADIEVRALFEPLPELGAGLPNALLDISLFRAVA